MRECFYTHTESPIQEDEMGKKKQEKKREKLRLKALAAEQSGSPELLAEEEVAAEELVDLHPDELQELPPEEHPPPLTPPPSLRPVDDPEVHREVDEARAEVHRNVGEREAGKVLDRWGQEEAELQAKLAEIPPTPHDQAKTARQRWQERMTEGFARAKARVTRFRKSKAIQPTPPDEEPLPIPPSEESKPRKLTLPKFNLPKPPRVDWEGLKQPFRLSDPVACRVWIGIGGLILIGTILAIGIANTEAIVQWSRETDAEFVAWDREATAEVQATFRQWQQELDQIPPPDPEKDWVAAKDFFRDIASR